MEARVKLIIVGDWKQDPTKHHWTASVRCDQCGDRFDFRFNSEHAQIKVNYMAEDIARQYAERCAPKRCIDCMINETPRV